MTQYSPGIRDKLIGIFVLIKVLPLIVLAWFAWSQISQLAENLEKHVNKMASTSQEIIAQVGTLASKNSIKALDAKSRETIERLTTDTARDLAAFLYDRDDDILMVANLDPAQDVYRQFIETHRRSITTHRPWKLNDKETAWIPSHPLPDDGSDQDMRAARIPDNEMNFHYRPPESVGLKKEIPLYMEITHVDLSGRETVKYTASPLLSEELRNVANPKNTYCRAETYGKALKDLKPGEIYVSEVIGPHVPSRIIGPYTPKRAAENGVAFNPENAGYAGKENPLGKRFRGLVRWATPVVRDGVITGYVTLALDHTHIMEFSDHLVPTEQRYSAISDAASGNYAFIWDYKGRNISHPRDYFIAGYDPETGNPAPPWLDYVSYKAWQKSGLSIAMFLETLPTFHNQSLSVKPSAEQMRQGQVALDCRYLDFAPQCDGWYNLTENGGSGSFMIFWSGLLKLTTAAAIPYHTGRYGDHPRGFGFVTIGANVDEFHRAATSTAGQIKQIQADYTDSIRLESAANQENIADSLNNTALHLTVYTLIMIVAVILIAIIMASTLTSRITAIVNGLRRFQDGERDHRLDIRSNDEIGQVIQSFNRMADSIQGSMDQINASREALEQSNVSLQAEVEERIAVEKELQHHKNRLEDLVEERTFEIENRMDELRRAQVALSKSEETFAKLFMVSPVWISLNRMRDGQFLNVNQAFTTVTGHSREEALESTARGLALWVDDASRRRSFYKLNNQGSLKLHEERFRMKNGKIRDFLWSASLVDVDGEECALSVFLDVTTLHRHEREMGRLRTTLHSIINSLPSLIIGMDTHHQVTLWNREAKKRTGVSANQATGQSVYEVMPWLVSQRDMIARAIKKGEILRKERCRTLWKGNQEYLDILVCPLEGKEANGAVVRIDTVTQKVRLEQRMIQTEKMQSIGSLAAGMAHEINNPLAGILQNVQVIRNRIEKDLPGNQAAAQECGVPLSTIQAYMEKRNVFGMISSILDAGRRAADIVANMLSFSRKSASDYDRYDTAMILDKTLDLIQNDYDLKKKFDFRNIRIEREYDKNVPSVICDRSKLQQVFFNILENGSQAMMDSSAGQENSCFTLRNYRDGDSVCIEIHDNGPGMDAETKARIFEPFFTTKPVGIGTGLGLYISYFIIVEDLKGAITVESAPGRGTNVIIKLASSN